MNAVPAQSGKELVHTAEAARAAGKLLHLAITQRESDAFLGEVVLCVRAPEMAAGYRYEGTLRSLKVIRGRRIDVEVYSRLRTDEIHP